MRSVLPLAVCFTLIAGLLRLSLVFTPPAGASENATAGVVSILAASRGHMLPSVPLPGGKESFSDAIAIGDLLLERADGAPGLRVALLGPRLDFQSYSVLPVPERAGEFRELVDGAAQGSILIAAVEGNVRAAGEPLAHLDESVRLLGATTSPFRVARNSWILVAHRDGEVWRALGEVYSESEEVHLALSLRPDLVLAGGVPQPFLHVESEGKRQLSLTGSFDWRTPASSGASLNRWARIGAATAPALQLGDGGTVEWEGIGLGQEASFACHVAFTGPPSAKPLVVELRIDGEVVATADSSGLEAGATRRWQVPLSSWSGKDVTLELRARQAPPVAGARILLGTPYLSWVAATP